MDCETLGTLLLKLGWDEKVTIGMGAFLSLSLVCIFLLDRVCRFMNFHVHDAILYLIISRVGL